MANNFTLEFDGQYQIVTGGDAVAFCAGTGSVTIQGLDGRSAGMMLKSSIWGDVASVSWNENVGSDSSNVGYYDTNMNWYRLYPTYSWNGIRLTITNLNLPSDAYWVWFASSTNDACSYSNLEILDANGNSLLESSEPSTGLPLYIGDSNIQAVKLGDVDISKMYIGDTLIYGNNEPAVSNNFRIEAADSNFSVVDGALEDFVSGDGYAQLRALSSPTYPSFNLYIDNSNIDFSMVKAIKFKRIEVSLHQNPSWNSNYGYFDGNNAWHYIAQNPSPVDGIMTFDNLSLPSDATKFQFGCNSYALETNGEYRLEEFDVLDANGNSILKS